ncbi:MAG: WecB/TagA/CpsF family glycosyltransferase [Armatimonadetes bacterium]|nr:WecB/TagA/CpsF family glycosyltransferase [Armatimonadota bacterium]
MQFTLFGARIDALTMSEVEERIADFIRAGSPRQVVTLNPEILYRAQQEPALLDLINGAALVTADGVGIVWAARMAGKYVPERVTGIDLMLRLVARAAREGWRIFLLGGAPGVAEEAAARLKQQHPQLIIAGTCHGYFQEDDGGQQNGDVEETGNLRETGVLEIIRQASPHLLFVGMGAPKQERFIARNLKKLNVPVAVGVGGSFDVLAGRVKRAPLWMQRLHLEWLGRLWREPRRWRRMLVLPRFAWRALLEGVRNRCRKKRPEDYF